MSTALSTPTTAPNLTDFMTMVKAGKEPDLTLVLAMPYTEHAPGTYPALVIDYHHGYKGHQFRVLTTAGVAGKSYPDSTQGRQYLDADLKAFGVSTPEAMVWKKAVAIFKNHPHFLHSITPPRSRAIPQDALKALREG